MAPIKNIDEMLVRIVKLYIPSFINALFFSQLLLVLIFC